MRCKRCNVILKNDGDLCENCKREIQIKKEMEKDIEVLLKVKQKYSPKYILTRKLFEVYVIFLLLIAFCFSNNNIFQGVLYTLILILIIFGTLIISKKNSKKNYIAFYETKVVFEGKVFFKTVKRELAYSEIKDIVFTWGTGWFENFFQKIFKLGNIYVYPKKGNIFSNGMQLEIVENFEKVMEDIKNIAGDKIING